MDINKLFGLDRLILSRLFKMEKRMSELDTDVAALSAAVATLTGVVHDSISALGNIVDTSSDDVAVKAATKAIGDLTTSLAAAHPAPTPAPVPTPAPSPAPSTPPTA